MVVVVSWMKCTIWHVYVGLENWSLALVNLKFEPLGSLRHGRLLTGGA